MTTTITDTDAESIVSLWTGGDLWISLHTADPGETGANEATAVGRVQITSASGWDSAEDDPTTGGRRQVTASQISFGNASTTETVTHVGFWTAETSGTFRGGAELTSSQELVEGNPVTIPAGDGMIVGAGHGQDSAGDGDGS